MLAAVLVPLADRLERMHVPRWLAATLVLVLSLSIAAATVALVVKGITTQSDEIWQRIEASLQQLNVDLGGTAGGAGPLIDSAGARFGCSPRARCCPSWVPPAR